MLKGIPTQDPKGVLQLVSLPDRPRHNDGALLQVRDADRGASLD